MATTALTDTYNGRSSSDRIDQVDRPAPASIRLPNRDTEVQELEDYESEGRSNSRTVYNVEDVPPNGGYAWVCTACVFFINAHTWGVNSAWAIFLAHFLSSDTYPGTTHLGYALIGGLSISQSFAVSPLVNLCSHHLGIRITLLIGTVILSGSLFAAGAATQFWHLLLSQGFLFGWGMGFLYVTATAALPAWFSSKRSLANGIATSGVGLGGLVYNLAIGAALPRVGPEWSYRILAFCSLGANGMSALLLKDRNSKVNAVKTAFNWREYLRTEVQLVTLWGCFTELGYVVLLYSLPVYASSIGLTDSQGAIVSAVLNLGLGIGRPAIGYFSDVFGRINVSTVVTLLCAVLCLTIWIPADTYAVLLVFALLSGVCCGVFWNNVAPVTAEVTGLQRFPSAFGMLVLMLVIPTTVAEPIALQIVSTSGYVPAQVFVGCMFLAGGVSIWFLRSWKLHDLEQKAFREEWAETVSRSTRPRGHNFWLTTGRLFLAKRV